MANMQEIKNQKYYTFVIKGRKNLSETSIRNAVEKLSKILGTPIEIKVNGEQKQPAMENAIEKAKNSMDSTREQVKSSNGHGSILPNGFLGC